jgi:molecular chaperone HtpG
MLSIGDIERLLSPALLAVFRADSGYSSKLVPVANKFTEWFRSSGTPFFKFYTDHSETHSIDVFRTALEFIAPEAQQSVSPQDLAILLAVSFCHDSGMHLTESQFQQLIARNNSAILCDLDSLSWPALWEIFLDEAKRFNQPTLVSIFGDAKP